ncbi:unnamed protein product [Heligmosomoides polygyrus]|uniref:OTU domain-containing protein n=1 Tax=Heligmosomoides polygyrus TaxID=6339 RepID=A0A183GHF7_HELPZ|nr:unnamed protein product [Heligmosomoides polygyrus]
MPKIPKSPRRQRNPSSNAFPASKRLVELGLEDLTDATSAPTEPPRTPDHSMDPGEKNKARVGLCSRLCHGDRIYSSAYYWKKRMDTIQHCVCMENDDEALQEAIDDGAVSLEQLDEALANFDIGASYDAKVLCKQCSIVKESSDSVVRSLTAVTQQQANAIDGMSAANDVGNTSSQTDRPLRDIGDTSSEYGHHLDDIDDTPSEPRHPLRDMGDTTPKPGRLLNADGEMSSQRRRPLCDIGDTSSDVCDSTWVTPCLNPDAFHSTSMKGQMDRRKDGWTDGWTD